MKVDSICQSFRCLPLRMSLLLDLEREREFVSCIWRLHLFRVVARSSKANVYMSVCLFVRSIESDLSEIYSHCIYKNRGQERIVREGDFHLALPVKAIFTSLFSLASASSFSLLFSNCTQVRGIRLCPEKTLARVTSDSTKETGCICSRGQMYSVRLLTWRTVKRTTRPSRDVRSGAT